MEMKLKKHVEDMRGHTKRTDAEGKAEAKAVTPAARRQGKLKLTLTY